MSFSLNLEAFAEKFKADVEVVVQKVAIDLLAEVVDRSPVGNPELWAANAIAAAYNNEVKRLNAEMRNDPANLTKNGRMKPGRLIKDGMDLEVGKGYVGGRFRGNWQVTIGAPAEGVLDGVDPVGGKTKTAGNAVILGYKAEAGSIWLVNNLPYAIPLEYGHSHIQAPYGMVRLAVTRTQEFIDAAVRDTKS